MAQTWDVRPLREGEYDSFSETLELAFGSSPSAHRRAHERTVFEPERALVAMDGKTVAGCLGAFSLTMTVPGAAIPVAGSSHGGVRPTHRRRRVMRDLMRRHLADVHRQEREPVAVALALEPTMWGQFGFGVPAYRVALRAPRGAPLHHAPELRPSRLQILDAAESAAQCEAVYARRLPERPGMLARTGAWPGYVLAETEMRSAGAAVRSVLAEGENGPAGYARYGVRAGWGRTGPSNDLIVHEAYADDPGTLATLWRFLLDQDHVSTVITMSQPVDHPLLLWLGDAGHAQAALQNAAITRLVDVGRALASRRYSREIDVVLEVADPFCEWNSGRWRLRGDPATATCQRTKNLADISLNVRDLATAYLGGVTLAALASAGLVTARRPGELRAVSDAFRHDPAAWLSLDF